ncbi:hypothetical protein BJ165DRAFT_1512163, partial [Panaeolus papilionaceus]
MTTFLGYLLAREAGLIFLYFRIHWCCTARRCLVWEAVIFVLSLSLFWLCILLLLFIFTAPCL